jgi:Raf kinase inhibitor-like YbhB/YbcL family protein
MQEEFMKLSSSVFKDGDKIPNDYAKEGGDKSPPLHIDEVPEKAKSLALIMDDPDAPSGTFNHWLLFNVSPSIHDIREGSAPVMATQGCNDYGEVDYGGPKPPSGEHRYFFKAFALDTVLPLSRGVKRAELESAMSGHILEQATLMGRYAARA